MQIAVNAICAFCKRFFPWRGDSNDYKPAQCLCPTCHEDQATIDHTKHFTGIES